MKRVKRRQNQPDNHPTKAPPHVTDRRLITVDDAPMRKHAATEFKRALVKLDKVRAEWQRFEQEDRPCFAQWMAATFGVLLTELRENERLVHEHTALIHEVEDEMMWGTHRNPRRAYAAVMKRREKPDADDAFAEADGARRSASRNGPDVRGSCDVEDEEPDEFDPDDDELEPKS